MPRQCSALAQKAYNRAYQKRNRQLTKAAEEQPKAHHSELCELCVGNGRPLANSQATSCLRMSFVLGCPKPQLNENTSLLQLCARHLKGAWCGATCAHTAS